MWSNEEFKSTLRSTLLLLYGNGLLKADTVKERLMGDETDPYFDAIYKKEREDREAAISEEESNLYNLLKQKH